MESGSVLSEPSGGNRGFASERSVSMVRVTSMNGKIMNLSFQQLNGMNVCIFC